MALASALRQAAPDATRPPLRAPKILTPITAVAARLGVTSRALRHYEMIGLISSHRGPRDLRLYDRDMVETLEMVALLRRVDIPIADIRAVIQRRSDPERYRQALQDLLQATLAERRRCVSAIEDLIETL